VDLADRDRTIQSDHWIVAEALQQLVEPQDLRPVRLRRVGRLGVHGGDRRL
jgi:hypothetical protein